MKRIGIIAKQNKPEAVQVVKELLGWFKDHEVECFVEPEMAQFVPHASLAKDEMPLAVDMVVVAPAMIPQPDAKELARKLSISYDQHGYYVEAHPKLRPVETNTGGIFLAGACQGPMDIPDCVAQGSAAASKIQNLFAFDELERDPTVAHVNETTCIGCWDCVNACPYQAIVKKEITNREGAVLRMVAEVNPGLCQGCGLCTAVCRSNSAQLAGFNDRQLYAEIQAL